MFVICSLDTNQVGEEERRQNDGKLKGAYNNVKFSPYGGQVVQVVWEAGGQGYHKAVLAGNTWNQGIRPKVQNTQKMALRGVFSV
jgi:hypothetical protein